MCNPLIAIAGATAATKAIGAVAGFIGQNQAAKANEQAANYNYAQRLNALGQEGEQTSAQLSENSFSDTLAKLQNAGRISASASDMGAGQQQTQAALAGSDFASDRQRSTQDLNAQSVYNQLGNEAAGANVARISQINSVPQASPLSLALGLGGAALSGASAYGQLGGDLGG